MISLIIKCYLSILLPIGIGAILLLTIGLYWILKKPASSKQIATVASLPAVDLSAISGDDEMATQLDLARAYLETDKKQLAENILNYVIQQGSHSQQTEAQQLLNHL